jgi:hypothetical protein
MIGRRYRAETSEERESRCQSAGLHSFISSMSRRRRGAATIERTKADRMECALNEILPDRNADPIGPGGHLSRHARRVIALEELCLVGRRAGNLAVSMTLNRWMMVASALVDPPPARRVRITAQLIVAILAPFRARNPQWSV